MTFEIINPELTRQMDLIPTEKLDVQINIIGAGAIEFYRIIPCKNGIH